MRSVDTAHGSRAKVPGWRVPTCAGVLFALVFGFAPSAGATAFTADVSSVRVSQTAISDLAIGDLDGDGVPDLVTADPDDDAAALLENDGSGNFAPVTCASSGCTPSPLAAGPNPSAVAIGDLNGDGRNDIVIAAAGLSATNGNLSVYTSQPDGSYVLSTIPSSEVGAYPVAVKIADVNGDGKPDLVIANAGANPGLTVLTRTTPIGAGATATATDYAASSPISTTPGTFFNPAIAVGDLNGDGRADIAITDKAARTVTVLYQNPAGGFTDVPVITNTSGPGPTSIAIGDVNGDGRPDLVVASDDGNEIIPLLKDATDAGFTPGTPLATGASPGGLAIGDFDGDGRNDIAVANTNDGTVTVFLKDATGTTYTPTTLQAETGVTSLAIGDLAGTGKLDIVTANALDDGDVVILANTTPQATTASLSAPPASEPFGDPLSLTAGVAKVVSGLRGSVAPTGTVTYTVDGRTLAPVALSAGSAVLATSALGVGPHTVDAAYSGDANYAPSSATVKPTVTAATNLTGNQTGPIQVTGTTSITDAHISGDVAVAPGATLDLEDSTITGDVTATGGGAIRICGSTISGSVSIASSTGLVVVGDLAHAQCAVNVIDGALTLSDNTNGVMAIGNSVDGKVTDSGNSGPGPFPGDVTTVADNLALALVSLSATAVTVPDTVVNQTSAAKTIIITNPTQVPLHISGVALTGPEAGQFALSNDAGCQPDGSATMTLAAGLSCTVDVSFAPTALGAHSASLQITSDASSSPDIVALSGTAVTPPTLDPSAVSAPFGEVDVGSVSVARTFTISDDGGAPLHISAVRLTGDGASQFAITADDCGAPSAADDTPTGTGVVAPGGQCTVAVTFNPTTAGSPTANLELVSDAATSPDELALSGIGVAAPTPTPTPTPATPTPTLPTPAIPPSTPPPHAPAPSPALPSNVVKLASFKAGSKGVFAMTLRVPDAGHLTVATTCRLAAVKARKGHKATKARTITFSRTLSASSKRSATLTLKLSPTATAAAALRVAKHLRVTIRVTFTPTGGKRATKTSAVTIASRGLT
jgi:Bacterial Ig-like domain (group 3)/FG-GAP-like repeat